MIPNLEHTNKYFSEVVTSNRVNPVTGENVNCMRIEEFVDIIGFAELLQ